MTPTEQDKELREQVNKLLDFFTEPGTGEKYLKDLENDLVELITLYTTNREREARIDEMKLHRHEWALFGDRPPYKGESVSLPILLAYHDDRIAELKAQQEEV